jgi:hypothetical protein
LGNIQLDSNKVPMAEEIDINSQVKVIRLHISTSFWEEKENEILEYRISRIDNPGDAQWSPVGESGIISFFSLSHGNYQVMLRKRTGLEESDFLYKQVVLHVSPKWYQTTVFGISAYLATIVLLLGFFYWRRNSYKKANYILEKKIDEATRQLQQANSTLEKKVEERTRTIQEAIEQAKLAEKASGSMPARWKKSFL